MRVTFSMNDGEEVALESLSQCNCVEQAQWKVGKSEPGLMLSWDLFCNGRSLASELLAYKLKAGSISLCSLRLIPSCVATSFQAFTLPIT